MSFSIITRETAQKEGKTQDPQRSQLLRKTQPSRRPAKTAHPYLLPHSKRKSNNTLNPLLLTPHTAPLPHTTRLQPMAPLTSSILAPLPTLALSSRGSSPSTRTSHPSTEAPLTSLLADTLGFGLAAGLAGLTLFGFGRGVLGGGVVGVVRLLAGVGFALAGGLGLGYAARGGGG